MQNNKPIFSNTRKRLEQAKFFFEKMRSASKRAEFEYYLDAFLASARSIFHVFEKEFSDNEQLLKLGKETEKKSIIKFFRKLRNISLKEYTPQTKRKTEFKLEADISLKGEHVKKVIDKRGKAHYLSPMVPLELKEIKTSFYFLHDFKWFTGNPDVLTSCNKYINELEKFVGNIEVAVREWNHSISRTYFF